MTRTKELASLTLTIALAGSVAAVQGYLDLRDSAHLAEGHAGQDYELIQNLLLFEVAVVFLTVAFNYGYFIIRKIAGLGEAEIFRKGSAEFLLLQQVLGSVFVVGVRGYLIFGEHRFSLGSATALLIAAWGLYRVIESKIKGSYQKPQMGLPRGPLG
ncbi:MAG: hypothetical protein ABI222_09735 [Opitutaceae bacterium]